MVLSCIELKNRFKNYILFIKFLKFPKTIPDHIPAKKIRGSRDKTKRDIMRNELKKYKSKKLS